MVFFFYNFYKIPATKQYSAQAEKCKRHFCPFAVAQFPAVSHPRIFNKVKTEPSAQDIFFILVFHGCFDPDLQSLVSKEDNENNEYYVTKFHEIDFLGDKDRELRVSSIAINLFFEVHPFYPLADAGHQFVSNGLALFGNFHNRKRRTKNNYFITRMQDSCHCGIKSFSTTLYKRYFIVWVIM